MRRIALSACLAVALLPAALTTGAATQENDDYGLPEDTGRDEVIAYCGPCHSMKLVVQQGLTREGWAEVLTFMYEEQEMDKLEPEDEKLVLDYLAKHVSPETQKQRLRQRRILR